MVFDLLFDGPEVLAVPSGIKIRLPLGRLVTIKLQDVRGPVRWYADNDEVLEIDDNEGMIGKITAVSVGRSMIQWHQKGNIIGAVRIEVYEAVDPAVTATITNKGNRPRT